MNKNKKLTQLADDMLRKADQADALKKLGEENPEQASKIENIFAAFEPLKNIVKTQDNIEKFKTVMSLIRENIKNSKGYNNFPESEYVSDKHTIFNIKHKVMNTDNQFMKEDMKIVNKIYKKHLNIQSILSGK